ncbi:hypothetical protein [Gellertiella hungarica]|uniref:Uncharacterized protein n=1 Tax=Gellertiella hungarica TaxID=1572859 RepID=A0A7W6J9S9_9HYPH|nr:hypothetical protein [Gellertiella hungarica]MBB4067423.1 hypothetical protein [Gellertiella hungarica]
MPSKVVPDDPASQEASLQTSAIVHADACNQNIGWQLEPRQWLAAKLRRAELDDQTERLATLLEAAGVDVRLQSDVVAISAVTGIVTDVGAWRPIRFLPAVAARDRRPILNALRYWIDQEADRPEYIRYAVVTSGDLVPAFGDLRTALKDLSRKISKWAKAARDDYGVEVHFRGSEFTRRTAAERGLDARFPPDVVLYHVHGNVLFQPLSKMPEQGPKSWASFLAWSHEVFGAHWKDCGRIEDPREIVKYVVKPAELLEGEKPLQPDEARWLHESLFRLNLAQPLGPFREFYGSMRQDRVKVVRVRNAQGSGGSLRLVEKSRRLVHSREEKEATEPGGCPVNLFIGVTMPMWQHTPWAEPMLLVQNYNPRPVGRAAEERLQEIYLEQMDARARWDRSGAPDPAVALSVATAWATKGGLNVTPFRAARRPSYKVHTSRLTVPTKEGGEPTGKLSLGSLGEVSKPPNPPPDDRFEIDPAFRIENLKLFEVGDRKRSA